MRFWKGAFALLLCLSLFAGTAFAQNSVFRQEKMFGLQFDGFTGSETHAMDLTAEESLDLAISVQAGSVTVTVKKATGETLYEGENPPPNTTVPIPEDGLYRISIIGNAASGSARIEARPSATTETEAESLRRLTRVQSTLGYEIELNPDLITFTPGDAMDLFTPNDMTEAAIPDAMLSITRQTGELDALELPAGMTEGEPVRISWRVARTARGTSDQPPMRLEYTFIEMDADTILCVLLQTSEEAAPELSLALLQMVSTLLILE